MSLGKTLMKLAIGIAIAKGVSSMTKGRGGRMGGGGLGGGAGTGRPYGRGSGGLDDIMGDILGGQKGTTRSGGGATTSQTGGGLGDLLDDLSGRRKQAPRQTAPKGGIEDLLGSIFGGAVAGGAAGGALGDVLGGGAKSEREAANRQGAGRGGIGDLLGGVLGQREGTGRPKILPEPEREEEVAAALMLRAVIQAVKADGTMDAEEKRKLTEAMGEASQDEIRAVNAELAKPVDVEGLAAQVPAGMEPRIYVMSLMAIDLDQQEEAQYLHALATALELSRDEVNQIHDKVNAPRLYR